MPRELLVQVSHEVAHHDEQLYPHIAKLIQIPVQDIQKIVVLKRSIDARQRAIKFNLKLNVFLKGEPFIPIKIELPNYPNVETAKEVIVVGAGPAGLFAALQLIELGLKPIVLERGKDVRGRRRDLKAINRDGIVNEDSNYCFGEGGAGTYSDGKLYTRSKKRGDVDRILQLLVAFGATPDIMVEAHPHIGTNKLPQIIQDIREKIIEHGGKVLFETRVTDILIKNNEVQGVQIQDGSTIHASKLILATGHSARDIFELLAKKKILIESKPFALGVRVEHPQSIIDAIQYHCLFRDPNLPPASYILVEQVHQRGVFSFCMCPGGIIAPAATAPGEIVVNGWRPSKRNNTYANSGMVVQIDHAAAFDFLQKNTQLKISAQDPLLLLAFQAHVEKAAFAAGGGLQVAPASRLVNFCENKNTKDLPDASYLPGLKENDLKTVLPPFVLNTLQEGFKAFGKKMRGYYTNDAIVVATESRTSSPVRIPRDETSLQHPQISNLYPCGEGAGYAGGIVSAAMDGQKCAQAIAAALL